ncbi:T9SS type A sorting domain-containing protein, partial [Maribacter chungangensis]
QAGNDTDCTGTLADVTEPVGSGTITSRNDFVPAEDRFKAFDNRRTRGDHSKWLDGAGIPTTTEPSWIQIVLEGPRRVEAITLTSANDDYGRDPRDFRLMASNGGAFTQVGSWSDQAFPLRYQTRTFELSAPGSYTTYRLEITRNDEGVELTQLAEIELLGCDAPIPESVSLSARLIPNKDNIQGEIFSFSPNPVGEARNIRLDLPSSLRDTEVKVTLYSMEGRLVHSTKFMSGIKGISHEIQLDQSLPTGIYLLEVSNTEKKVYRKKMIVK